MKRTLRVLAVTAALFLQSCAAGAEDGQKWLTFSYEPRQFWSLFSRRSTMNGVENSEAVFPRLLKVDYTPVAELIRQGTIARAWWGVDGLPNREFPPVDPEEGAVFYIRPFDLPRTYNTQHTPYEAGFVSLLFELPDGSRVGPHTVPNDASVAPALPAECLAAFSDWPLTDVICQKRVEGVDFAFYKGAQPMVVNLVITNGGLCDIADATLDLRLPDRRGQLFFMSGENLLYLPAGASVAISNVLWPPFGKDDPVVENGVVVQEAKMIWRIEPEDVDHLSPEIFVSGNRCDPAVLHDLSSFGLKSEVWSREWVGRGHEIVVIKLTNETGRRILDLESVLEARSGDGKLLARAPSANVIMPGALDMRHGSSIYMRYHLRNVDRLPDDAVFAVKLRSIHTDPPMALGATPARPEY